jgi:4-hydroxy-tetrahydrodipicolinate synthase
MDRYDNIAGFHCTSEVPYLNRLIELVDGRGVIYVGGPMHALTVHALGGQGFLCTEGNLAPQLCGSFASALREGDLAGAESLYARLIAVHTANIWPAASVRFLKTSMKLLGLPGHHPRPPFDLLDAQAESQLRGVLKRLSVEEWSVA